ncbi:hypothetical protein L249_5294 [Ophiocordyceps polyrhachis-furcata BCC 54312]|uniref:Amidohydrolase-related domain-containing protein n=1 Tax=Ophiocordyceps polyrhachis-furcata BCC 54312 TaxID=1330021 RepID=A0A367L963_9HYPO|nr:hypothetical protein L249_5294 [Ophiocordyceps polyrhachis-furcata BCC 54312]
MTPQSKRRWNHPSSNPLLFPGLIIRDMARNKHIMKLLFLPLRASCLSSHNKPPPGSWDSHIPRHRPRPNPRLGCLHARPPRRARRALVRRQHRLPQRGAGPALPSTDMTTRFSSRRLPGLVPSLSSTLLSTCICLRRGIRLACAACVSTSSWHLESVGLVVETVCRSRPAPFGWVLDIYLPAHRLPSLVDIIPTLGVKVVLDHIATPARGGLFWLGTEASSSSSSSRPGHRTPDTGHRTPDTGRVEPLSV